jgi:hypothetical protein
MRTLKLFCGGLFTFFCLQSSYASEELVCPTLSRDEIKQVITNGRISTDLERTLAIEAGKTPAQVIINEPTANPYDTYYNMTSVKKFNNKKYIIYIGNVLAGSNIEAMDRAQKILLNSSDKTFSAKIEGSTCVYKEIYATASMSDYPFKSEYEDVALIAYPACKDKFSCKTIQTF